MRSRSNALGSRVRMLIFLITLLPAFSWAQTIPSGWQIYHPLGFQASTSLSCAASAKPKGQRWNVSLKNDSVSITTEAAVAAAQTQLPPKMSIKTGMLGKEEVMSLPSGTLIGFDAGEFEGGLWFLPLGSLEPFQLLSQNVVKLLPSAGGVFALVGTNHAGIDEGKVYSLSQSHNGRWTSAVVADLHAVPLVAVRSATGFIVVTDKEIVELDPLGTYHKLGDVPQHLEPNSVVVDSNNDIYVGMSLIVLRLHIDHDHYLTDVLIPSSCRLSEHVGKNGEDYCDCG